MPGTKRAGGNLVKQCIDISYNYGKGCYIRCEHNTDCQYGAVCLQNYWPPRCAFPL
jgi:hypothetical protein